MSFLPAHLRRSTRFGARLLLKLLLLWSLTPVAVANAADLPAVIERVKPSIVAIGTYKPTRRPPAVFLATGFVVGDGNTVITNSHAVPEDAKLKGAVLAVYTGTGREFDRRRATLLERDDVHDLAVLQIDGGALPTLRLGDSSHVREGEPVAFTGFPIGMVLGIYPATHRGIVSAITPIAQPQIRTKSLSPRMIKALRNPYDIFQLDATAYPGNSGSPLYRIEDGTVIGVINKVFVKTTKENVLKDPSGITYAIPIRYARELLR